MGGCGISFFGIVRSSLGSQVCSVGFSRGPQNSLGEMGETLRATYIGRNPSRDCHDCGWRGRLLSGVSFSDDSSSSSSKAKGSGVGTASGAVELEPAVDGGVLGWRKDANACDERVIQACEAFVGLPPIPAREPVLRWWTIVDLSARRRDVFIVSQGKTRARSSCSSSFW